MKKEEIQQQKLYLKKKFGINNMAELRQAAKKIKLDIGIFVTPMKPVKAVK